MTGLARTTLCALSTFSSMGWIWGRVRRRTRMFAGRMPMRLGEPLVRIANRLPSAPVPDHRRPRTASRDYALEATIPSG